MYKNENFQGPSAYSPVLMALTSLFDPQPCKTNKNLDARKSAVITNPGTLPIRRVFFGAFIFFLNLFQGFEVLFYA